MTDHAVEPGPGPLAQELAELRTRLAARDAELSHWKQQCLIAQSLWTSAQQSRGWRLLAPLRWLRGKLRPAGFDQRHLIAWQQLEPGAEPGAWASLGPDPYFVVPCLLPAGWVRVRLRMTSAVCGRVEFFADSGGGFSGAGCFERVDCRGGLDLDFVAHFPRPVRAVRFDPLDREGRFRLYELRVEAVPRRRANVRLSSYQQPGHYDIDRAYEAWLRGQRLADAERAAAQAEAATAAPLISVLLIVGRHSAADVRQTVASLVRQANAHWELCVAVAPGAKRGVLRELARQARADTRIKVLHAVSGIASALNTALQAAAGEFFALIEPGDEIADHALLRSGQLLDDEPGVDLVYSDEDRLDAGGRHVCPFFKPGWSPEYLLACMYTGRLGVYRTARVRALGGFRAGYEPAAEYDLVLRLLASGVAVRHLPEMLYHRRERPAVPGGPEAARRALADFLRATDPGGAVEAGIEPGTHRVRYALRGRPLVSVIIPCLGWPAKLAGADAYAVERCVDGIRRRTAWDCYEIFVVSDAEFPADLERSLAEQGVRRLQFEPPLTWSAACNRAVEQAGGSQLLFLHDDVEPDDSGWMQALLEFAQQPAVGAVGGKLLYPDGRLQHAGVALLDGTPGSPFQGAAGDHLGYFAGNVVHRNASAVSGACLMTRADVFHAVGGFTESLGAHYADVDYCLKVLQSGKRAVYTPFARPIHHEPAARLGIHARELDEFRQRWQGRWAHDPYYNPNLSRVSYDYRL